MQFLLKTVSKKFIKSEISSVGFDNSYIDEALKKHIFLSLKIFSLDCKQATILKQTALSKDCDCAIHKNVLDNNIDKTDCVLSGTISQLLNVSNALLNQPFNLSKLAAEIKNILQIELSNRPKTKIMGILNLTPDSFSDGGDFFEIEKAINHSVDMIEHGADIIDIGAQSTRPNADMIDVDIEIKRIVPILTALKAAYPNIEISVDTFNLQTAKCALELGCDIINDVSFLKDVEIAKLCAATDKKLVVMHSRGNSKTMDSLVAYDNIVDDIYKEIKEKTNIATLLGVKKENIIIDVGFGFAKTIEQNFKLLNHISDFKALGYPILAGHSRKRFLQDVINTKEPKDSDIQTLLCSSYLISQNIDIIRVHNVELTKQAVKFNERLNLDFQELL